MAPILVPNYFSITKGQLAMSTPYPLTIIIRVGVGPSTHGGMGNGPTVKARVLIAFNPITEFFEELHTNYQDVKTKNSIHYKSFNVDPMKVCKRRTCRCGG